MDNIIDNQKIKLKNHIFELIDSDIELKRAIMSPMKDFLSDTIEPKVSEMRQSGNLHDYLYIGEPKDECTGVLCIQANTNANYDPKQMTYEDFNIAIHFYVSLKSMQVESGLKVVDSEGVEKYMFYSRADFISMRLKKLINQILLNGTISNVEFGGDAEGLPFSSNSKFNFNSIFFNTQGFNIDNLFGTT